MEYITLGSEGNIKASRVGFGTGSSGFTGFNQQTKLTPRELADLLVHAFDKGINLWDTGYTYGTYPHIREALKTVRRDKVVIVTKFGDSFSGSLESKLTESLKILQTDYIDICLIHGVRNSFEINMRSGALRAMLKAKEKGYIRAVGLSAHGIGALESALKMEDIDILLARVNWSGASMDAYQEEFLSKLVAVPYLKEFARKVIPKRLIPSFSRQVESTEESSKRDQEVVGGLLQRAGELNKDVVAMKVFGAGSLTKEIEMSMRHIMSLNCIKAFLLGMTSKSEIDENIRIYEKYRETLPVKEGKKNLGKAV